MENNSLKPDEFEGNRTLQVKEDPRTRKSGKKWKTILIIAVIAITGTVGALLLSNEKNNKEPETPIVESTLEKVDPITEELKKFGTVTLLGKFGASPTTLIIDFNTMTGTRNYNATPTEKYSLKIESVDRDNDGNYTLTITDLLEGRIPIGTYTGQFDGDTFKGVYNSKHGKRRNFDFSI